jgi:hypothetical protein
MGELDQVIVWRVGSRIRVRVEYFDPLGRLRREDLYPPWSDLEAALDWSADLLRRRGLKGSGRVRQLQGSRLVPLPELQARFLRRLQGAS